MDRTNRRARGPLIAVGLIIAGALILITQAQAAPVTVTTLSAANITATSAQLGCSVNPGNLKTKVWFVYGPSGGSSSRSPTLYLSGGNTQQVAQVISGLRPSTTYKYRCKAINADVGRAVPGTMLSFTTGAGEAPTVVNGPATDVTASGATLNCTVNPRGANADAWATYKSASDTWGSPTNVNTPVRSLTGATDQPVAIAITGLDAGTTYEYRCSAQNGAAGPQTDTTSTSFTTDAVINPPLVDNVAASSIGATTATMSCDVNPRGTAADVWITYHKQNEDPARVLTTTSQGRTGSTSQRVNFAVDSLAVSTGYEFRCNASNGATATQVDENSLFFTTLAEDPPTEPPGAVTIMAAGDLCGALAITCAPAADLIRSHRPDRVLVLGDMQYPDGTIEQITAGFAAPEAWGSFKDITIPVPGNHERRDPSGPFAGYCQFWGAAARCGSPENLSYRYDLGRWSVVVLENNGAASAATTERLTSLLTEANAENDNVVLAMHKPRWSTLCTGSSGRSGCHASLAGITVYYDIAVAYGVDMVLAAHDHKYERTDRMDGSGPNADGVPQFLSGLGGAAPDAGCDGTRQAWSLFCVGTSQDPAAGGERTDAVATDGVLKVELSDDRFTWQFIAADGSERGVVIDSGEYPTR